MESAEEGRDLPTSLRPGEVEAEEETPSPHLDNRRKLAGLDSSSAHRKKIRPALRNTEGISGEEAWSTKLVAKKRGLRN